MLIFAKRISSRVLITILTGVGLIAGQAWAGPITVNNFSFESPSLNKGESKTGCPPSWTCNTGFNGGVWYPDPAGTDYNAGAAGGTKVVPDGNQVTYSYNLAAGPNSIAQTTAETITNNTIYTLDLWAGHPNTTGFPLGASIQLYAWDGTTATPLNTTLIGDPGAGKFAEYTLPFTSLVADPFAGQKLGIKLLDFPFAVINTNEINWDLVTLNSAPGPAVPEPSSMLLLGSGLAGLGFWRRRQS